MSNTNHRYESYEEFVEKYRPKKTTDDCMTPPDVMKVVQDYVAKRYDVDSSRFVRPFYPGGDFEAYPYKDDDIVVDNPPFSISSKIITFYKEHGIPFFIFVQGRTPAQIWEDMAQIHTGRHIIYDNGAKIDTAFLTNLERHVIIGDPELGKMIAAQPSQHSQTRKKPKIRDKYELSGSDLEMMARVMPFRITDYTLARGHSYGSSIYSLDTVNLKEQFMQDKKGKLEEEAKRWQT